MRCDVTRWEDQLAVFKEAALFSPNGKVDIVIANAGIDAADPVFTEGKIPRVCKV